MAISNLALNMPSLPSIPSISNSDKSSQSNSSVSFGDFLKEALNDTANLQIESNKLSNDLIAGNIDNLHTVMIESEKADIALQLTLQLRNKILDAYKEIMNMQV
jgi:flagellar hook-basal body complex protein FliE